MLVNVEKIHNNRLKEKNIVIIEKFMQVDKNRKIITWRSSDGKYNDDVHRAIKVEKEYLFNGQTIYCENDFDKESTYNFISLKNNEDVECPNCGYRGKSEEFNDGCPYCLTSFSVNYSDEEQKKFTTAKPVVNTKKVLICCVIISLILSILYFLISLSSGDILSILAETLIFFCCIIVFLLTLNTIISISKYVSYVFTPEKNNIFGEIRNKNIADVRINDFFNAVNYELSEYYYDNRNRAFCDLIDFDVIEYNDIAYAVKDNHLYIECWLKIRKVFFQNSLSSVNDAIHLEFVYGGKINKGELKVLVCPNCGKSVDIHQRKCTYCHTDLKFSKTWELSHIYKI